MYMHILIFFYSLINLLSEYSTHCYYWTWHVTDNNCFLKKEHGLNKRFENKLRSF